MRILLASDLHFTLRQYDWLASVAADFDVVAIAGDHLDVVSSVSVDAQIIAVRTTLEDVASRTRLLVCSGNHDLNTRNDAGEKAADWLTALRGAGATVDGDSVDVGTNTFTVLGWWDGPSARAETERMLTSVPRADRWIWVYHSPPHGPLAWTGSRHFGDPVLAAWIERWRPDAVLTGHIHQAPFTAEGSWLERVGDTWVFNAGRQIGEVPARVEIDLDGPTARWVSLAGTDERVLNAQ